MDKSLADLLYAARKTAGLSQKQLAEQIGYAHHSEISRIERGEQQPGRGMVDSWVHACKHRLAVIPEDSDEVDAVIAALEDVSPEHRDLVLRLIYVLPVLPALLVEGLENDVRHWEQRYRKASRSRA